MKQLEKFCKRACLPIGYIFLNEPVDEKISIVDFRTVGNTEVQNPSVNLIDTYDHCIMCQDWYKNYLPKTKVNTLKYFTTKSDINEVSNYVRNLLDINLTEDLNDAHTKRKLLISAIEKQGVVTILSGFVGTNSRRALDKNEFRGFSLYDEKCPLIFINRTDSVKAQIFTLIHEFAHILLKQSGLSNNQLETQNIVEQWCNRVTIHSLLPSTYLNFEPTLNNIRELSNKLSISSLCILIHLHNLKKISIEVYNEYRKELDSEYVNSQKKQKNNGGNYYLNKFTEFSPVFMDSVIFDAYYGNTPFNKANKILNMYGKSFEQLAIRKGIK
jgi:Zn-dependent peptidase ImmA (M78 family)